MVSIVLQTRLPFRRQAVAQSSVHVNADPLSVVAGRAAAMRFALGRRLARLGRHQTQAALFKMALAFAFALYSVAAALGTSTHAQAPFKDVHGDGTALSP